MTQFCLVVEVCRQSGSACVRSMDNIAPPTVWMAVNLLKIISWTGN